jgi:vesicle coat complex subunit
VEELIALLDDSDRQVRREAARALGEIGDARAIPALINKLHDPAADMVEEAAEGLGRIPNPRSLNCLIELLQDERPLARKSAAIALGEMGDERAQEPLQKMLEHERDPVVFVAAAEALSKIGGHRVLHILRRLLRTSSPGVGRKELANSIGNLLGPPAAFYRLLEADSMAQEAMVARALGTARRHLFRTFADDPDQRAHMEDNCSAALHYFTRGRYGEAAACMYRLASAAVRSFAASDRSDPILFRQDNGRCRALTVRERVKLLVQANEHLRVNLGFLSALHRDARRNRLHREEGLLAAFAYQQVMEEMAALEQQGARLGRVGEEK